MSLLSGMHVRRLALRPGDRIVLSAVDRRLSLDQIKAVREQAEARFPDHDVIVLSGLEMTVIEPTP